MRSKVRLPPVADVALALQTGRMAYSTDVLEKAYAHTSSHRQEVESSSVCACFYCLESFAPAEIERWLNEGSGTAICPHCDIDSVLGAASGLPVEDPAFLRAMNKHWF